MKKSKKQETPRAKTRARKKKRSCISGSRNLSQQQCKKKNSNKKSRNKDKFHPLPHLLCLHIVSLNQALLHPLFHTESSALWRDKQIQIVSTQEREDQSGKQWEQVLDEEKKKKVDSWVMEYFYWRTVASGRHTDWRVVMRHDVFWSNKSKFFPVLMVSKLKFPSSFWLWSDFERLEWFV